MRWVSRIFYVIGNSYQTKMLRDEEKDMTFDKNMLRLYAVTDRSWLKEETLYEQVKKAIEGGVTMVQLREKDLDEEAFEKEAKELLTLCHSYGIPLLINDNVSLAKRIDADGVHIGQSDMEMKQARELLGDDKIIGVTAKTVEQARTAQAAGATYLGSGAVFGTSTKKDAKTMDLSTLKEIVQSVDIPVVAIGGICLSNARKLKGTGIAGIAVVSGIFASEDIQAECERLSEAVTEIIKNEE